MTDADVAPPTLAESLVRLVRERWVALLASAHLLKWAFWFRAMDLGSPYPFTNVDYIQFYGRALRMHEFLLRGGRIWGYDPFDMAGYLSGPFLEVGTHFLALIAHLLHPAISIARTTLIVEIIGLVGAPFLLVPAARFFGATKDQAWSAFGVGLVMLGTFEVFSTSMYKIGLWGWMTASFMAPLQVGLFWRWTKRPSGAMWALFTAVTLLSYQIHPSVSVVILLPNVAIYILQFRTMTWRQHLALFAAAALTIAANSYWLVAFIYFGKWRSTAPYYDTAGIRDLLERFSPLQQDFYLSVRAFAYLFVGYLALRGWDEVRRRDRGFAIVLAVWVVWLTMVAYFGSALPGLRTVQPGRNEFPLWLLLFVLAGFAVESYVWRRPRPRAVALAMGLVAAVYVTPWVAGQSPWAKFATPLGNRLLPWQVEVIRHLTEEKPRDTRVLLECNDDLNPHFADVVPLVTGAILIGGQHPGNFLRARSTVFTGFYVVFQGERSQDPIAFGHLIRTMGESRFAEYLELYNVGLIYASTPGAVAALDDMTDILDVVEARPPLKVYRVRRTPSWFTEGSGDVRFDYDRIIIGQPSRGRLVLKAHWLSTLTASPHLPLRPVYLMDDPVPFIEIDNSSGANRIEIYNAGLPPLRDILTGRRRDDWGNPS